MRSLFILLFCSFSLFSFGQATNRDVVISFWNSNIQSIIDFDQAKIIAETNFPVEGSWGYVVGLESSPEEWTKEDFVKHLEQIFTSEYRAILEQKTYNDLVHHTNDAGQREFIINLNTSTKDPESGEVYESAMIMFFKQFDNKWKLYSIEFAG